jgi:hypothetical protein
MKRLVAIGMVWVGCAVAWMILGSTISFRAGSVSLSRGNEVYQLWGPPLTQTPPRAFWQETTSTTETVRTTDAATGQMVVREVSKTQLVDRPLELVASDIQAAMKLEHRRKGLLWFPTYDLVFNARYSFSNQGGEDRPVIFQFNLGGHQVVYDGFRVEDQAGHEVPVTFQATGGGTAQWRTDVGANEVVTYRVRYRTRGTTTWHYQLGQGTAAVKRFKLTLKTDFNGVNFPAGTLSPSRHQQTAAGHWQGEWDFSNLVSSSPIGIELPQLLNPGPLAEKITFFAPVGLLFFFFVVAVLAAASGQRIHPLNFFMFGCAFFAFHLLFAYLVDHLPIGSSFVLASAVSTVLVVSYARLFVGWKFALREMGLSQLIYLVLFSFTFFWKGFTGLAITVGSILTLFVMMQVTGRTHWQRLDVDRADGDPLPDGAASSKLG